MPELLPNDRIELDYRKNDGLEVFLMWHKQSDVLSVALIDYKHEPPFTAEFSVPNGSGLDAFNHPYAHMPESMTQKL